MKKFLRYFFLLALPLFPVVAKAQFESFKDSVVQLYGVVMTSDSLRALPAASIFVKGTGRGTITNNQGVFSIVVLKGDIIEFTSVGFKPQTLLIPRTLVGNQYSVLQLMVTDTVYLPASIIKARPTASNSTGILWALPCPMTRSKWRDRIRTTLNEEFSRGHYRAMEKKPPIIV